jgi:hypothetical protein
VATFSAVTRQHVLQAIAEYDSRGADDFLGVYGFAPSGDTLEHEGRTYDALALVGVAHRYATGRLATSDEVGSGRHDAAAVLRRRGFAVDGPPAPVAPVRAAAAPRSRAATPRKTPTPRAAAPERVEAICPTCFTALPATGICDNCG